MHELSIVASLVDRVQREVDARGATAVHRLHVRVGELCGVEVSLLRTAFETFRERTCCAGASLDVQSVPARWECPRCNEPPRAGDVLRCRRCDLPARLGAGDELLLESIEMEFP